jgi:hypothetical protein
MKNDKNGTKPLGNAFDKGTRTVEDIHLAISDLPFGILKRLGVLEKSGEEIKKIHDETVGAIYDTIREVGHKVAGFADDLEEDVVHVTKGTRKAAAKETRTAA